MTENIELNIRQMQVYAAMCLMTFCNHINVKHNAISGLIDHLFAILTATSLPDWERAGAALAITGRGDPLPHEVDEAIPERYKDMFTNLLEYCVEVGIVDMYGADTTQPRSFLEKCLCIIHSLGLEVTPPEYLLTLNNGNHPWGEPVSEEVLRNLKDRLKDDSPRSSESA